MAKIARRLGTIFLDASDTAGESGEDGQRLQARLDVAQVDLRVKERELVVDGGLATSTYQDLGWPSVPSLQR